MTPKLKLKLRMKKTEKTTWILDKTVGGGMITLINRMVIMDLENNQIEETVENGIIGIHRVMIVVVEGHGEKQQEIDIVILDTLGLEGVMVIAITLGVMVIAITLGVMVIAITLGVTIMAITLGVTITAIIPGVTIMGAIQKDLTGHLVEFMIIMVTRPSEEEDIVDNLMATGLKEGEGIRELKAIVRTLIDGQVTLIIRAVEKELDRQTDNIQVEVTELVP